MNKQYFNFEKQNYLLLLRNLVSPLNPYARFCGFLEKSLCNGFNFFRTVSFGAQVVFFTILYYLKMFKPIN